MNLKTAIARSGTSQKDRVVAQLSSQFVSIEERSISQQLEFAKKLSEQIRYYDENNQPVGDWSKFLILDTQDILAYLNNPADFAVNLDASPTVQYQQRQKLNALSQPHVVMFLMFLQMTVYIRARFNELTEKHLDFYYKDVLKIKKQLGAPDKVHVLFELAGSVNGAFIAKGTLLDGGTDAEGNVLHYAIDENFAVNRAQISQIKTLRLKRKYLSLNDLRKNYSNGFEYMLRWALGQYFQGDFLPAYPKGMYYDTLVDISFLLTKYQANLSTEEKNEFQYYVEVMLGFVSLDDFNYCMSVYARSIDTNQSAPSEAEWVAVAVKIDDAFNKRWKFQHIKKLIDIYRPSSARFIDKDGKILSDGLGQLESLFDQLFGDPEPGDQIPPMPSTQDTLISLYNRLNPAHPNYKEDDDYALAARYVTQFLYLSKQDYLFILKAHQENSFELYNKDYRIILDDPKWSDFFSRLVRAETRIRKLLPPDSGRWDAQSFYANPKVVLSETNPLPAFGEEGTSQDPAAYYQPGLAIVSPNLYLEGGERALTIEVACKREQFPMDDLKFAKANGQLHFDVFYSGEQSWLRLDSKNNPDQVKFDVDVIGEDVINTYQKNAIYLLVTMDLPKDKQGNPVSVRNVIMTDGSVWDIAYQIEPGRFALTYSSIIQGISANQHYVLPDLNFVEIGAPLRTLQYVESKGEVHLGEVDQSFGARSETVQQGDFIRFYDGLIVQVTEVFNKGSSGKVQALGYYPVDVNNINEKDPALKYTRLDFREYYEVQKAIEITGVKLVAKTFTQKEVNNILLFPNGLLLQVRQMVESSATQQAQTSTLGNVAEKTFLEASILKLAPRNIDIRKKDEGTIFNFTTYPGFRFHLSLNKDHPAVVPAGAALALPGFHPGEPAVRIELKNVLTTQNGKDVVDTAYEFFTNIHLHKVKMDISVKAIENLQLANDQDVLPADAPFKPFTDQPLKGSAFYFSHPELSRKKLATLDIGWKWVNLPEDLRLHYEAYVNSKLSNVPVLNNSTFKAGLSLYNNRSWLDLEDDKILFQTDSNQRTNLRYAEGFNSGAYAFIKNQVFSKDRDPRTQQRYFRFALREPDFQHKVYPYVIRKLALEGKKDTVYEPYTPEVTEFSVGYTVHEEIVPDLRKPDELSFAAHMYPFGALNVVYNINPSQPELGAFLLPNVQDEGVLYLGFINAVPGDELSFLVQVVAGSGESAKTPNLHWYYRTLKGWQPFPFENLLDDTTRAMTFSGLMRFRLPQDATDYGPLMPAGQYWIAIHAPEHAAAGAKVLMLKTQVGRAVLQNKAENSSHKLLPAGKISKLVNANSSIASVTQPYSSFDGYGVETDALYRQRVSERLRHKGRSLTASDYERIVLAEFPDIAHVKCLNQGELVGVNEPGVTEVIVVPDLNATKPFFPLKPSVTPEKLDAIANCLIDRAPVTSQFKVKNPVLEPVIYRVAVRFKEGYGRGVYSAKIIQDIILFLCPWSVDFNKQPAFGEKVYYSSLIYHLEKLPYIDYVAVVRGFKEKIYNEGTDDQYVSWGPIDEDVIRVARPDSILVSNDYHVIDVISSEHFNAEDFKGIGYMIISLDNVVY